MQLTLSQPRLGGWPGQSGYLLMPVIIRLPGRGFSGTLGDRTKQDFRTRAWEQLQGVGALNKWTLDYSLCTVNPFMSFSHKNLKNRTCGTGGGVGSELRGLVALAKDRFDAQS